MSVDTAAVATEVPLFSECVLGYRAWMIDDQDRLWPIADHRVAWEPGINTARCNCATPGTLAFDWSWRDGRRVLEPHPAHEAPSAECTCGLYSWRRPRRDWTSDASLARGSRVCGAVASWGQIQVHATGFRAENACVVSLAYPPGIGVDAMRKLERVAERYRVELVPLDRLEEAASRHGSPLPDSLQPQDEPDPRSQASERTLSHRAEPEARVASRRAALPDLDPIPFRDQIGIAVILCCAPLTAAGSMMWLGRGSIVLIGVGCVGTGLAGFVFVAWWLDPQRVATHAAHHVRHHAIRLRDRHLPRRRPHPEPTMTEGEFEAVEDALEPLTKYGSGLEGVSDPYRRD
jgi:hypothetical protein